MEATRLVDQLRPQLLAFENMIPAWWHQLDELQQLQTRLTLPTSYLKAMDDLHRSLQMNPVFDTFSSLADRYSEVFESIQVRQLETDRLIARMSNLMPDYSDLSSRILDSMVPVEVFAQIGEASQSAVEVLLGPQAAFQDFANRQLGLAAESTKVAMRNRLLLVDSSTQILETLAKSLEFAAMVGPLDVRGAEPPGPNVFSVLDRELVNVDFSADEFDSDELIAESQASRMAELGYELTQHVYLLNVDARRNGQPNVFKPTNRSFLAAASIVTTVATDEDSFTRVVDDLYFLLYEGSGDAKRLCDTNRGDLSPLWLLKQLRRGARHDLDHGSESEEARKHERVGDAYKSLTGLVVPLRPNDWITAQVRLYSKLVGMLAAIGSVDRDEDDRALS